MQLFYFDLLLFSRCLKNMIEFHGSWLKFQEVPACLRAQVIVHQTPNERYLRTHNRLTALCCKFFSHQNMSLCLLRVCNGSHQSPNPQSRDRISLKGDFTVRRGVKGLTGSYLL